ncbi:hypothetical protein VNI00_008536 [Paramarasmius palmivorus]|uniref:DUF6534 domain-containing protein n=1 Tax=Paramarasmius palmivorus TaxID=297713 RepID=A0AAW0CW80_9AGAR
MDSKPTPEDVRTFAASCGAMMIGTLLAAFLGGLASLQTALFFGSSKNDHWAHKTSVFLLWVIDILQLCFIFHATYYYVIKQGVNNETHNEFIWSLKLQIFLQTLVMSATKLLYTIRIWKLRRLTRTWIPIVLFVLLAAEYGLGSFFAYEVTKVDLLKDVVNLRSQTYIFLSMALNSATDIIVALALVYTLVKSRPSLEWTNSNVTMLAAYVINTGGITGIFSVVTLIGFALGVTSPLYIVAIMVLPQLYVNCFLSMLNASYYFQTQSSLDLSISYRNPSEYNLEIPRAGFGKDMHSLARRPRIDSFDSTNDSEVTLGMAKSADTINELGLPLFRKGSMKSPVSIASFVIFLLADERYDECYEQPPIKKIPVEVQVETTQTEYTIDRRMVHHDWQGPIGDVWRGR